MPLTQSHTFITHDFYGQAINYATRLYHSFRRGYTAYSQMVIDILSRSPAYSIDMDKPCHRLLTSNNSQYALTSTTRCYHTPVSRAITIARLPPLRRGI